LPDFQAAGVLPIAISVDSPQTSANLRRDAGYSFTFLSDPTTDVIRRYRLLHPGGGPDKHDIARPAEFLVDPHGIVRWVNFTEDIRVRARAGEMLTAAQKLQ
jgi:peroxiredoxin